MRAKKLTGCLAVFLLIFSGTTYAGEGIKFEKLSLKEAVSKASKENKLVFVDVYASWCGPCKYLSREVFTDKKLAEFYNKHFVCVKIDGEKGEGPGLMSQFDLDAYPSLLFIDTTGNLIKKKEGAAEASTVMKWGRDVFFPEESDLFKAKKRYEEGPVTRSVMVDYAETMAREGLDPDTVVKDYLKRFPKLDLFDNQDFTMFVFAENELDDPIVRDFLSNVDTLLAVHGEGVQNKIVRLITIQMRKAVEKEDEQLVSNLVNTIYPAYSAAYREEAFDKPDLSKVLLEMYRENTP